MAWSKEAEQSLLGACMLEETAYDAIQEVGVTREDFHSAQHKAIWEAIDHLAGQGKDIDIVTVVERLSDKGQVQDAGGIEYVSWLVDATPNAENAKSYAEIVFQWSRKRKLKIAADSVVAMLDDGEEIAEVIDNLMTEIIIIGKGGDKSTAMSAGAAAKQVLDELEAKHDGIAQLYTTGIKDLDSVWYPEPNRLHIIAGRPKMGKSTLSQMTAEANAANRVPVYLATMEMSAKEMAKRHIASLGRVDRSFFKDPNNHPNASEQYSKLAAGMTIFKDLPIQIDYCPGASINDILARAKAWFRTQSAYRDESKGILIVDHLGLVKIPRKGNTATELGDVTSRLKNAAGEMSIPIILLCQLNRGLEQRPNKRPVNSDLRDSGRLEEDADTITFVYRDEVYDENSQWKGTAELITGANRDGEIGTVMAKANLRYSRFEDMQTGK